MRAAWESEPDDQRRSPTPYQAIRESVGLRYTLAVLVLIVAIGNLTAPVRPDPDPPKQLVIEEPLLAKLQTLADGLHNEIVLCLEGSVRGDTAYAADFFMPAPTHSSPLRSVSRPCPGRALATWHNHPLVPGAPGAAGGGKWSSPPAESPGESRDISRAERLCALSGDDIETSAALPHPFVVVGVDAHVWCWWSRVEVVGFRDRGVRLGSPEPGKLWVARPSSS